MQFSQAMDYINQTSLYGSVLGLDTMGRLMAELGQPHRRLRYVHVAGTNGKGSTASYVAHALQAAGYRTGLYLSPYIQQFGERIQVDGVPISHDEIAAGVTRVKEAADAIIARGFPSPTVFELVTTLGLLHFEQQQCDIVVAEVGLGGRLDATNIIEHPEAAVITAIGMDHMDQLGDTIPLIAGEKAGIIKPGCDVVLSAQDPEAMEVIRTVTEERGGTLHVADYRTATLHDMTPEGICFDWEEWKDLQTGLTGLHQLQNAVTAVKTCEILRQKGWNIPDDAVRAGLQHPGLPGRLEPLCREPLVLADGAHNPHGVAALMKSLPELTGGKPICFVMGMLADKDYARAAALAAEHGASFCTVAPPSPRALSAEALAKELRRHTDVPVRAFEKITDALDTAMAEAKENDGVVCVFGSLYQLGAVRTYFGKGDEA